MKKNVYITLIITLAFLMTVSGCVANTPATDITTAAITSAGGNNKRTHGDGGRYDDYTDTGYAGSGGYASGPGNVCFAL